MAAGPAAEAVSKPESLDPNPGGKRLSWCLAIRAPVIIILV